MSKKLAILGHEYRAREIIKLLEILGGKDAYDFKCSNPNRLYYILDEYVYWDYNDSSIVEENKFEVFTLEKFLEKFPFKVGDFVRIPEYESEVCILKMKWCPLCEYIEYLVCPNDEDEWNAPDYGCGYRTFERYTEKDDIKMCMEKYSLTWEEYYDISSLLEEVLCVGQCSWCS